MYPLQYPSVSKNDLFPLKRTQRRSGYDFLLSNFLEGFSFSQEIGRAERKFKVGLKNGPTFGIQSISIFLDVDKVEQVEE